MKITLLLSFICLFISSCSVGPISGNNSARTAPSGNWQADLGLSPAAYASIRRGMTENWELGASVELQFGWLAAITSKYSFYQQERGFSFALAGSAYKAFDFGNTTGATLGPIVSLKLGWFESYLESRFVYVRWNPDEISSDRKDDLVIKLVNDAILKERFYYRQTVLGFNFWLNPKAAINLNVKHWHFTNNFENLYMPGIGLILNL